MENVKKWWECYLIVNQCVQCIYSVLEVKLGGKGVVRADEETIREGEKF